jgi:hypothetical protein
METLAHRLARFGIALLPCLSLSLPVVAIAQARDPGVRQAATDGGPPVPLPGATSDELAFFQDGLTRFTTVEMVSGAVNNATSNQGNGLGPRFNSNQCSSCHQQPFVGGSSPAANPLIAVASAQNATNQTPWFITANGPAREARFVRSNGVPDGGVHNLFVVSGRSDVSSSCNISQPTFTPAGNPVTGQGGNPNIVFRIPTPMMGAGLIEAIADSTILANVTANAAAKQRVGITGHANSVQGGTVNLSANDGTVTRFGWKAQNKSLLMFAGEAYNVEMGISNQLFPQERDETPGCQGGNALPNDTNNFPNPASPPAATAVLSDIEAFADFMRLLAPPAPAAPTPSSTAGHALFAGIGCALCHVRFLPLAERGVVGADGAPVLGPARAPHGQRARGRHHAGRCRTG